MAMSQFRLSIFGVPTVTPVHRTLQDVCEGTGTGSPPPEWGSYCMPSTRNILGKPITELVHKPKLNCSRLHRVGARRESRRTTLVKIDCIMTTARLILQSCPNDTLQGNEDQEKLFPRWVPTAEVILEQTKRGNTLAGGSRAGVCTTECVHPVEHLRVEVRASRKGYDLITRGADQPQANAAATLGEAKIADGYSAMSAAEEGPLLINCFARIAGGICFRNYSYLYRLGLSCDLEIHSNHCRQFWTFMASREASRQDHLMPCGTAGLWQCASGLLTPGPFLFLTVALHSSVHKGQGTRRRLSLPIHPSNRTMIYPRSRTNTFALRGGINWDNPPGHPWVARMAD
ncbi:uncharacterized protein BO96DRAFT_352740 [Aspergillus niger CBS 101883]|uniref:Uncharacterized protein n=3 Tax=Aspergillus niger TaxID=5061 RepID=A2Q8H3_ASPNC|nr:uncharacterized protein BO96DRAFT_352740 [Aspergillus niger CBS 101883]XP_059599625.1 hypothetical protein An01g04350 [Aspergillus niger]PYH50373.1 hypothetical protein BO96DRAFT_352740 [Aspergillus niger CBS 101883]RDH14263.1 hypothetical protein M747DRAFT_249928 [Aspergillus niger ATCC 13496]CAK36970.1 hypothetical protein An01g04350 [Aspergillus niger]